MYEFLFPPPGNGEISGSRLVDVDEWLSKKPDEIQNYADQHNSKTFL